MVKVPHEFTGRTRPSNQGMQGIQADFRPIGAAGAAIGRGLMDFSKAMEMAEERKKETQRFDALNNFASFETNVKLRMEELKQATPEDAANFFDRAGALFDDERNTFLNNLPAEFQQEFEYRANQVRQGVIMDAFKFDFEQQNLFFTNKINEHLNQAKIGLDQNPQALELARADIVELIDASGLPEIEKTRQRRLAETALEAITYKSEVRTARDRALTEGTGIANRNLPPQASGILNAIAKRESGGRYDIRYDGGRGATITNFRDHPRQFATITSGSHKGQRSSAAGKYQFIGSTWDLAAEMAGVRDFSPESQDAAAWAWAQDTYRKAAGGRATIEEAIERGDWASIKRALGTQWEGVKHMSVDEFRQAFEDGAGEYGSYQAIENDGRFSNLSFEDRQSLRRDADREAQAEYNARMKAQQEYERGRINDLYTGLFDGNKGEADINALRTEGILRDYDDINKAHSILNKNMEDMRDFNRGQDKLNSDSMWILEDSEDKKFANALYNKGGGREMVEGRNEEYVQSTVLPMYDRMQMIAPDMANSLAAMMRNSEAQAASFALETMRQLRERNAEAFAAQFDNDTQKKLDFWEVRRGYYTPEEIVDKIQNRGVDQATRQAQTMLRQEAREVLKQLERDEPSAFTVEEVKGLYEGFWNRLPFTARVEAPIHPTARTMLETEYREFFTEAYADYNGDVELAKEAAQKQIMRAWAPTNIGGVPRLMKWPPERAGYRQHEGSYDWIERAVRTELELADATVFELYADERTQLEIADRYKDDEVLPSYLVLIHEEGLRRFATMEDGTIARMNFVVDQETLIREEEDFRRKQERADRDYIRRKFREAFEAEHFFGTPVPPELRERMEEIEQEEQAEREVELNQPWTQEQLFMEASP